MRIIKVGEFEVTRERLKWLVVCTRNQGEQARMLDVISEIERREAEEIA